MTGFGAARGSGPGFSVSVELRSVNNRHLKVSVRGTDPYPLFEAEFEKAIRARIRRGSVLVQVKVERESKSSELRIDTGALRAYKRQVIEACDGLDSAGVNAVLSGLLALPGVAPESAQSGQWPEDEWPTVEGALKSAMEKLDGARKDEGRAMADELLKLQGKLRDELQTVKGRLPEAMPLYRERILERVRSAVADAGVSIEADQLIREVAIFADRTDVAEEVTRFAAHLEQFEELVRVGNAEGAGRRLEFVVQELGREANTMGSKAGDVSMSRCVVELKATLERIRELIQNIE